METLKKERTLANDPQYFGAYLNMARHNVFTISNHVAEKINPKLKRKFSFLKDEENIPDSFIGMEVKEKPNLFFTQLVRFLPIVKVHDSERLPKSEKETSKEEGTNYKLLADKMKLCFAELNEFRNDYSHYYSKTKRTQRKLKINENLALFLRTNFMRAIEYTKTRFTDVFEDSHFNVVSKRKLVDENNQITQDGLVFFVCIFLEREYAFQFINRIIGLRDTRTQEFRATREVFSAFCVNLPHDRFISDEPEQAFVLDLLNELNRCPADLYNNITDEGKKQFQPDVREKIENIEKSSIPEKLPPEKYEEYIQSITTKKRRQDRFPYFAMRYFDIKDDFDIQLHLNLGKILLETHKKMVLGKEEESDIVEDIKLFGKLKNFDNEDNVIKKIDKKNKISFLQFNPHFHIESKKKINKIGFSFSPKSCSIKYDEKNRPGLRLSPPDGFLSLNELPKAVLLDILNPGKVSEIIKAFLNVNKEKILNKEFIEEIKGRLSFDKSFNRKYRDKSKSAYSEDEEKKLKDRKSKLNDELKQYGLNDKQIPGRILDYWLNINAVEDESSIANKIKGMKKDCKDRIKAKAKNKAPKIGAMATFLARDIVNMIIDEGVKNKINAFYYDKIQECLALYADEEKKKLFIDICKRELKILDKEKGHPFLSEINLYSINKTSDLYEKYLTKKGDEKTKKWSDKKNKNIEVDTSWLANTFYQKEYNTDKKKMETKIKLPKDLSRIPFSIRNLTKEKSNLEQWLNNVTKGYKEKDKTKPVDLPTNIFDNELVNILRKILEEKKIQFDEKDRYSRLLELWLNDTQPFYNAEREYNVYDETVKFKLGNKEKFKYYFEDALKKVYNKKHREREIQRKTNKKLPPIIESDILNVFNNAITENEKLIRFYQTKDRIILRIVKDLIKSDTEIELKLSEIHPLSEKSPLNHQQKISQNVEGFLSYDEDSNYIKNKNERTEKISRTIKDIRKRKDYSIFKEFTYDKRLAELFEYYDEDSIEYNVLEKELDEYNKCKELVFDRLFELEKKIIEKPNALSEMNIGDIDNIQHEPYLDWLIDKEIIDEEKKAFLNAMRNSFSHNQFPPKRVIKKLIEIKGVNISKDIFEKYNMEIDNIIEKIV